VTAVQTHTFAGFLLYDVLTFLHPTFDPAVKDDRLRYYVAATGSDGYQAIVAWGEIAPDFENKAALLAFKGTAGGMELTEAGHLLMERLRALRDRIDEALGPSGPTAIEVAARGRRAARREARRGARR
jgi:hypothetical protein